MVDRFKSNTYLSLKLVIYRGEKLFCYRYAAVLRNRRNILRMCFKDDKNFPTAFCLFIHFPLRTWGRMLNSIFHPTQGVHFHENLLSSKHYSPLHFMCSDKNPFLTHIRRDLKQRKRYKLCWLCVLSDYHCALWGKRNAVPIWADVSYKHRDSDKTNEKKNLFKTHTLFHVSQFFIQLIFFVSEILFSAMQLK